MKPELVASDLADDPVSGVSDADNRGQRPLPQTIQRPLPQTLQSPLPLSISYARIPREPRLSAVAAQDADQELANLIEQATRELEATGMVDVEALAQAHPQHAERLRDLLPAMQAIACWGHAPVTSLTDSAVCGSPDPAHPTSNIEQSASSIGVLGDFRILREIGRGGMGVVYEAEQISLGRRVALKVLPFAAMLDRQQLARFKNEARAAATLDHANIVAIYSVGSERGVHFYAMQLIEGQSLAEVVEHERKQRDVGCSMLDVGSHQASNIQYLTSNIQKPASNIPPKTGRPPVEKETAPPAVPKSQPPAGDTAKAALSTLRTSDSAAFFRTAAQLGIQAAEALDHAHEHGILHRDIKPANLLVECTHLAPRDEAAKKLHHVEDRPWRTERGGYTPKLWVTDFGLARIEADAGMTMTGDILGTLRYMSPEQVLAKRAVIDHRSDIYSLGVTLYELLTLQPAYTGEDRQELLRKIATDEPRPPQQLNPHIPSDLGTIVLKAIEKNPADRYASARELADDLQRFVDHRPIHARPATYWGRLVKWSRRHHTLVATAGFVFMLLSMVLGIGVAIVNRERVHAVLAREETADLLYLADTALAYQSWDKGWSAEAQAALDRHLPRDAESDRRGFEWHLLDAAIAQPVAIELAGHVGSANEIAISPDGRWLASVGDDGTLRTWDLRSHTLLQTIKLGDQPLYSVAISPDGRYVAAGSKTIYLCDLIAEEFKAIFHYEHNFESLAFRADGKRLAAGSRYHDLFLITPQGKLIAQAEYGSRYQTLEFIPGSTDLLVPIRKPLSSHNEVLQVWGEDLSMLRNEYTDANGSLKLARVSAGGQFIVAASRAAGAVVIDRQTGQLLDTTARSRASVIDVAIAPNTKTFAVGYSSGIVELYEVDPERGENGKLTKRLLTFQSHQGEVSSLKFVDNEMLATCGEDGLVKIWSFEREPVQSFSPGPGMLHVLVSPDNSAFAYTHVQGCKIVTMTGKTVWQHLGQPLPSGATAWSHAGDYLAVAVDPADGKAIRILDRRGNSVRSLAHPGKVNAIAFSPNDEWIASAGNEALRIHDARDGSEIATVRLPGIAICLAFAHDGTRLVYGTEKNPAVVLSIPALTPERELEQSDDTNCLVFSPDDSLLAGGTGDGAIRIWEVPSWTVRSELYGHERGIKDVAFSADGQTLLSAALDGSVRLWSVRHGREFGTFFQAKSPYTHLPEPALCRLSLSGDGRSLVIGTRDSENRSDVHVWQIPALGAAIAMPHQSNVGQHANAPVGL